MPFNCAPCCRFSPSRPTPEASVASSGPSGLAGEEGFEPPHPVLETGGLPLNLLPFKPRASPESVASSAAWLPGKPAVQNRLLHFFVRRVLAARLSKLAGVKRIGG